ncbi:LRR receptor kinase BAK1 [Gossypium hirsutum]|uniref:LRR receptor kinase BAK1 n=1 Tax=Gossypium hirsutum TaxID=3635 RepID=A0A1U8MNL6_GOSHI|nr:LRR receptor kinase BAK1-like [Gossypium hirsutum]
MASNILVYLLFVAAISILVDCNSEGDALHSWRTQLVDPNNVLKTWDPTLVNPCSWFHVTCNRENSVIRVDLGNAGLSGPLVPDLGLLPFPFGLVLEVFANNLTGIIPKEIGNLTKLVSMDLQLNKLAGPIPSSVGNLVSLLFLRLDSNKLSGTNRVELLLYIFDEFDQRLT